MTTKTIKGPFRFDQVGSLLRPDYLKEAREAYAKGTISKEQLTEVEDKAITEAIEKQKEVGLKAVTDGEFRRRWWHLDFIQGLNGITIFDFESEAFGIKSVMQGSYVSGRLSFDKGHPFIDHFKFTKEKAGDVLAKQTIPGPNLIYLNSFLVSKKYNDNPVYESVEIFKQDLITTYQDAIKAFYEAGCRYLQIDDTSWGSLFDETFRQNIINNGGDPDALIIEFGDITEAILVDLPEDLTLTFHFCKGNFQSKYLYNGSYDRIAERLLSIEAIDGFFLEFDDERSGSFEPLKNIKDQKVILGLITSKSGELEDKESIKARIKEASQFVPLEQLCLSPQCGFASTHEGNHLTEEDQWNKLRLVTEIAQEVWSDN